MSTRRDEYEVERYRTPAAAPRGNVNHLLQYETDDTDPEVGSASGHSVSENDDRPRD